MAKSPFVFESGAVVPGTKWELVRKIADGGMGSTWLVQKPPGIAGVLKTILPDLVKRSDYVKRFFGEVAILTKLNHPNIVQVFDFDTLDDGTPFFVMERLHGKTLSEALVRKKDGKRVRTALPARIAYEISRQICEALHRAHSHGPHGVIHRDIKPANIFIHQVEMSDPVVKLLDFGVAMDVEPGRRDSGLVGTPRYMAPEQLRCEELTPKVDLYAMALVLYEMLTGRGPFDDAIRGGDPRDASLALVNAHLLEVPPPPSQFVSWIPPSVDALILSALDKDPEKRPIHAYAFATKLYELQFVNDGTPRTTVDANTTAPTLVTLLEDGEAPPSAPRAPVRTVPLGKGNDTVPSAPPEFDSGDLGPTPEIVDPLGATTPKVVQRRTVPMAPALDRNAPTRDAAGSLRGPAVPRSDTEIVSYRELQEKLRGPHPPGGEAKELALPKSQTEPTPITSSMSARRRDDERVVGNAPAPRTKRSARPDGMRRLLSVVAVAMMFPLGAVAVLVATRAPRSKRMPDAPAAAAAPASSALDGGATPSPSEARSTSGARR